MSAFFFFGLALVVNGMIAVVFLTTAVGLGGIAIAGRPMSFRDVARAQSKTVVQVVGYALTSFSSFSVSHLIAPCVDDSYISFFQSTLYIASSVAFYTRCYVARGCATVCRLSVSLSVCLCVRNVEVP